MSAIRRLATSGGGLNGQASETISNQMRGGDSLLSMRGGVDPGMEYLRGQMGARNSNLDGLESFTGNANPVLDRMYEQAARKMRQEVSAQFSRSGGYGSGYHQETMGRNLGDMATNLYGGAYESDANRRLSAAGQLAGFGESALNRDASNAGALSQMYGNNRARDIGITQQDIDNKYRAAGMAGQLDGNRYNDAEKLMGIGAIGEDRDALVRQEQASGYDFNRDADFNRQVQLSQAMQGLLGNYRTQNQSGYNTQTGFGPSIFNQGVGAISALASATASAGGGG
jgi:hypothetical protein